MRKNLLLTIVVCAILATFPVYTTQSQTAESAQPQTAQPAQPTRPVPVPTLTGAASMDPNSKSTGIIDWSKTAQETVAA